MKEDIEPPDSEVRVYASANGGSCALINGDVLSAGELFYRVLEYENGLNPRGFLKNIFSRRDSGREYQLYCCALDRIEQEREEMARELLGVG